MSAPPLPVEAADSPSKAEASNLPFWLAMAVLVAVPGSYYLARLELPGGPWWPLPERRPAMAGFAFVLLSGTSLVCLPPRAWKAALVAHVDRWTGSRLRGALAPLLASGLLGLLLVRWQRVRGVVGDAVVWTPFANKWFTFASEPLGRWMHYFAYRFLGFWGVHSNELAVRLPSYLAGVALFYVALLTMPRVIGRARSGSAALFFFCAPVAVFFFGYPSTCPWAYGLVGIHLLAGLRYLSVKPNRAPWLESLLIGLAAWSHGMALFATGSQAALILIWLFSWPGAPGLPGKARRLPTAFVLSLIPFVFTAGTLLWCYKFGSGLPGYPWAGNARGGIFQRIWVKWSGDVHLFHAPDGTVFEQFVLLGHDYDAGILNLVLWLYPGVLLTPLAAVWLSREDWKKAAFLLASLLGLLGYALVKNPDWGYETDIRTLGLFALPAGCLLTVWLSNTVEQRRWHLLVALCSASAFAFTLVPYLSFP